MSAPPDSHESDKDEQGDCHSFAPRSRQVAIRRKVVKGVDARH
jgi:hypothetical protein